MTEAKIKRAEAALERALKQSDALVKEWKKEIGKKPSAADKRTAQRARANRAFMADRGDRLVRSIERERAAEERNVKLTAQVAQSAFADYVKANGAVGQAGAAVMGGLTSLSMAVRQIGYYLGVGSSPAQATLDIKRGIKDYYDAKVVTVLASAFRAWERNRTRR